MRPAPAHNLEDFLHVAWDPQPADTRCRLTRRRFVGAVGGLVITLLVWGVYYGWSRHNGDSWKGTGQWQIAGVVVGLAAVLVIVRLVLWRLAVRHRRRVGEGEVVTASWPGIQVAGHYWDWDRFAAAGAGQGVAAGAVTSGGAGAEGTGGAGPAESVAAAAPGGVPEAVVATVPGTRGRWDRYVVTTPDSTWECDVDDLAVTPAALDQALRLYSRGRCRVDLSGIAH